MTKPDVLVIGGGISGASFAYHAARSGRKVVVIDKAAAVGGCLTSSHSPAGYWYELGGHTCYNSYGAFIEILEGCGLLDKLQPRGKSVLRFLRGDEFIAGKNLWLLIKLFSKFELLRALPRWFGDKSQAGQTVRSYYSRFVGPKNYDRVLGPMLSAVPSQDAHDFPADMLFKKRERRQDVMRSFTLPGGLGTAVAAALGQPGIEVLSGRRATSLGKGTGDFAVTLEDGTVLEAPVVALAVPPSVAAALAGEVTPAVAHSARDILEAEITSFGFAVRKDKVENIPYSTFMIPLDDTFHSVVTRDVVPDDEWRAFTFHFRPGTSEEQRKTRAAQVLGVSEEDMEGMSQRTAILPSPRLGHHELIACIDDSLRGGRLAVTGNWFDGLSIEDCVLRSRAEWQRISDMD